MVEHRPVKAIVAGSSPASGATRNFIMIKEIKVNRPSKTIPAGFSIELKKITVITGENNTGKTNFIKAVDSAKGVEFIDDSGTACQPQIVYIPAENVVPSANEWKAKSGSANLIVNLAKLFANLGVEFQLEKKDEIAKDIENLAKKATDNLKDFSDSEDHELGIKIIDGGLAAKVIVQALIESVTSSEAGEPRELDDLGQGTQRIIIAAILKAYLDILIEKGKVVGQPILILFEEPEIYLHPKLKRTLNATLEDISNQDNHQVIITTHDPYFAFMNLDEMGKKLYSFEKNKAGVTEHRDEIIVGIEDQLLFIFLYSRLEKKKIKPDSITIPEFKQRQYIDRSGSKDCSPLKNLRDQIHHPINSIGLIKDRSGAAEGKNYYTEDELSGAISAMSKALAGVST